MSEPEISGEDQSLTVLAGIAVGCCVGLACAAIAGGLLGIDAAFAAFGAGWLTVIVMAARKARLLP